MRHIVYMVIALMIVGCNTNSDTPAEESSKLLTPEKQMAEITTLENDLKRSDIASPLNMNKAKNLVRQYQIYINSNPSDSVAASYLYKAADLSVGVENHEAAIKYIDKLIQDHPDFEKLPEIMLFKGFVYEAHMNNHANAVNAYEALRDRFPNHRLAADAKAAIDNLTLTEEELLRKFEQMNGEQEPES